MGLFSKSDTEKGPQKATGDDKLYFILHNLLSTLFFLVAIYRFHLYNQDYATFIAFLKSYGILVGLTILFGFASRVLIYIPLRIHYDLNDKTILSFYDINQGINEFFSYAYILRTLLSMGLFAIWGKLFTEEPWETTIIAYLIIKALIYVYIFIKYK